MVSKKKEIKVTTKKKEVKKKNLCKKGGNILLTTPRSKIILRSELFDNNINNNILNLGFRQNKESKNPYKYLEIEKDLLKFVGGGSFASFYNLELNNKTMGLRVFTDVGNEILSSPIQYYLRRQSLNNNECKNSVCQVIDYGTVLDDQKKEIKVKNGDRTEKILYTILELGNIDLYNFYRIFENLENKDIDIYKYNFLHKSIIRELIKKIKCIHKEGILHLDIKPENIIIVNGSEDDYDIEIDEYLYDEYIKEKCNKYIKIKFIDFGFSKIVNDYEFSNKKEKMYLSENFFGTPCYLPDSFPIVKIKEKENKGNEGNYKEYSIEKLEYINPYIYGDGGRKLQENERYAYSIHIDLYVIGKMLNEYLKEKGFNRIMNHPSIINPNDILFNPTNTNKNPYKFIDNIIFNHTIESYRKSLPPFLNNKVKTHLTNLKTASDKIKNGSRYHNNIIRELTTSGLFFSPHGSCNGDYGCEMEKVKLYHELACSMEKQKKINPSKHSYNNNLIKKVKKKAKEHALKIPKNYNSKCSNGGGKKSTKKKTIIKKGGNDFPFKMPELLVFSDNNKEFQGLKQMSQLTELTKSMKSLEGLKGAQGLQGLKDLQGLQDISKLSNVSKVGGKKLQAKTIKPKTTKANTTKSKTTKPKTTKPKTTKANTTKPKTTKPKTTKPKTKSKKN